MYQRQIPTKLQIKQVLIRCKVFLFFSLFLALLVIALHLSFFTLEFHQYLQVNLLSQKHILNLNLLVFQDQIWIDILHLKSVFTLFLFIMFFSLLPFLIFAQDHLKEILFLFLLALLAISLPFRCQDLMWIFIEQAFLLLLLFLFARLLTLPFWDVVHLILLQKIPLHVTLQSFPQADSQWREEDFLISQDALILLIFFVLWPLLYFSFIWKKIFTSFLDGYKIFKVVCLLFVFFILNFLTFLIAVLHNSHDFFKLVTSFYPF